MIMGNAILFGCIAVLVPCLDQLTKYLVRTFMEVGDTLPVIRNFFHITYSLNDGMAFGSMGGEARWVFMIFTPVALGAVLFYLYHYRKTIDKLSVLSLSMIFAGGASNMIDRIFFIHLDPTSTGYFDGRVVDFLDFRGIWNAIFNVADAFVVVGVFLFLFAFIRDELKRKKQPAKEETVLESGKSGVESTNGAESPNGAEGNEEADIPQDAENSVESNSEKACEAENAPKSDFLHQSESEKQ